ncbi:MAG: RNA polymerase sigma factor SigJ [Acidimicrobiales bacterium]
MDPTDELFVTERPRLIGLAYRILGSRVDAEDAVHDAWLRLRGADVASIERPEAWLTTVVARLALDQLKSARHRREVYVGPWLPEPVRTGGAPAATDPAEAVALAESLTAGFLQVLELLDPVERVVFLLADVFRVPHDEIALVVDKTPGATRQIASRARRRVHGADVRDPSGTADGEAQKVADALVGALLAGDLDRLTDLVSHDVVLLSDGGADVRAARRPVVGPERVGRFLANMVARLDQIVDGGVLDIETGPINGEPGVVVLVDGRAVLCVGFTVDVDRVYRIRLMRNPDKLRALDLEGAVR